MECDIDKYNLGPGDWVYLNDKSSEHQGTVGKLTELRRDTGIARFLIIHRVQCTCINPGTCCEEGKEEGFFIYKFSSLSTQMKIWDI